ncbi:MAG: hypothetical protein JWP87_4109, partial [Labilithrix sp.]|nr:hypothetical protein [Labilithrix sp.]
MERVSRTNKNSASLRLLFLGSWRSYVLSGTDVNA